MDKVKLFLSCGTLLPQVPLARSVRTLWGLPSGSFPGGLSALLGFPDLRELGSGRSEDQAHH